MIFKKETFKNLLKSGANSHILPLSSEERKVLYATLSNFGLKKSRAYTRIFREGHGSGFDEWELRGIYQVVADFMKQNGMEVCSNEEMKSFYSDRLIGNKEKFWEYMQQYGMSKPTCLYRFRNWNFQEWELVGMRHIINRLCGEKNQSDEHA